MTIERSHGKARPTLPRASDLGTVETGRIRRMAAVWPDGSRRAIGLPGSVRARRQPCASSWGAAQRTEDIAIIAGDAIRLFNAAVRDLPSDGPVVRSLAALYARHAAVSAYFNAKADGADLTSEAGAALLETALRHGQRVERLAVTMLDVATRLAKKDGREGSSPPRSSGGESRGRRAGRTQTRRGPPRPGPAWSTRRRDRR